MSADNVLPHHSEAPPVISPPQMGHSFFVYLYHSQQVSWRFHSCYLYIFKINNSFIIQFIIANYLYVLLCGRSDSLS